VNNRLFLHMCFCLFFKLESACFNVQLFSVTDMYLFFIVVSLVVRTDAVNCLTKTRRPTLNGLSCVQWDIEIYSVSRLVPYNVKKAV